MFKYSIHLCTLAYVSAVCFNSHLISLSKFNLSLIGTFTWPTPPGPYRATTCGGRELNIIKIHTFLTTQGHGGPPRMSDQPNAGATSETAQTWKTIHTNHTVRHPNKVEYGMMITTAEWNSGTLGPKVSWHLSYRWGKTPKKNLTQETCPDWGSNPGLLRDKRACYHLLHSGGQYVLTNFLNVL